MYAIAGGLYTTARILFFYAKAKLKSPKLFWGKRFNFSLLKIKERAFIFKRKIDLSLKGSFKIFSFKDKKKDDLKINRGLLIDKRGKLAIKLTK